MTTWNPVAHSSFFVFFFSSPVTCTPHEVIFQPEFCPFMNRIGSTHGSCAGLMDAKAFGCIVLSPNLCSQWLPFLGYCPTITSHWCVPPGSRPFERRLASCDVELASLPSPSKNIVGGRPRHWEFFQLLYAQNLFKLHHLIKSEELIKTAWRTPLVNCCFPASTLSTCQGNKMSVQIGTRLLVLLLLSERCLHFLLDHTLAL